jgi:hypothetical protein
MKARQSKAAKLIFGSESNGRAVIREIHSASKTNAHVIANVKVGSDSIRIKEL